MHIVLEVEIKTPWRNCYHSSTTAFWYKISSVTTTSICIDSLSFLWVFQERVDLIHVAPRQQKSNIIIKNDVMGTNKSNILIGNDIRSSVKHANPINELQTRVHGKHCRQLQMAINSKWLQSLCGFACAFNFEFG